MDQAACQGADPDLFFNERGDKASLAAARLICADCPVNAECLNHALDNRELHGVWGGTTEKDRRAMRRNLARACARCGDRFRATSNGQRYCGKVCALAAQRERQREWEVRNAH